MSNLPEKEKLQCLVGILRERREKRTQLSLAE